MRFAPGFNGTGPPAATKMEKVGVPFWGMLTLIDGCAGLTHWLLAFVWQMLMASGSATPPVSAVTVMVAVAPTFEVATANAPEPPTTFKMLFGLAVAEIAMMSGTGVADAVSKSVLMPENVVAGAVLLHWKFITTFVGPNGACGVKATRYV